MKRFERSYFQSVLIKNSQIVIFSKLVMCGLFECKQIYNLVVVVVVDVVVSSRHLNQATISYSHFKILFEIKTLATNRIESNITQFFFFFYVIDSYRFFSFKAFISFNFFIQVVIRNKLLT